MIKVQTQIFVIYTFTWLLSNSNRWIYCIIIAYCWYFRYLSISFLLENKQEKFLPQKIRDFQKKKVATSCPRVLLAQRSLFRVWTHRNWHQSQHLQACLSIAFTPQPVKSQKSGGAAEAQVRGQEVAVKLRGSGGGRQEDPAAGAEQAGGSSVQEEEDGPHVFSAGNQKHAAACSDHVCAGRGGAVGGQGQVFKRGTLPTGDTEERVGSYS